MYITEKKVSPKNYYIINEKLIHFTCSYDDNHCLVIVVIFFYRFLEKL